MVQIEKRAALMLYKKLPLCDVASRLGIATRGDRFACPRCGRDDEKRGTLRVTDGRFSCVRCPEYGDSIDLVRLVRDVGFRDAVEWLSSAFGLRLPWERDMFGKVEERAKDRRFWWVRLRDGWDGEFNGPRVRARWIGDGTPAVGAVVNAAESKPGQFCCLPWNRG
ncbi:MAG TPA: hypothetical protein VMZ92_20820 [Planctomycetota bacterium]|nr:hypothetical protein [Planctomycetota bacterium]